MDKVILLKKHKVTVKLKSEEAGRWEKGKYTKGNTSTKIIQGVFLPVSSDILKYYSQGAITLKDMEFFTKELLKEGDLLELRGEEWKVIEITNFDYIADIRTYILRRSTKDD